jgi:hypothetical protein
LLGQKGVGIPRSVNYIAKFDSDSAKESKVQKEGDINENKHSQEHLGSRAGYHLHSGRAASSLENTLKQDKPPIQTMGITMDDLSKKIRF